jgi:hypothetical protein
MLPSSIRDAGIIFSYPVFGSNSATGGTETTFAGETNFFYQVTD